MILCVFSWNKGRLSTCFAYYLPVRSNYQFFPWTSDSSFRISRLFDIFCVFVFPSPIIKLLLTVFVRLTVDRLYFPEGTGPSSRPGWCKQQPAQEIVSFHIFFMNFSYCSKWSAPKIVWIFWVVARPRQFFTSVNGRHLVGIGLVCDVSLCVFSFAVSRWTQTLLMRRRPNSLRSFSFSLCVRITQRDIYSFSCLQRKEFPTWKSRRRF